MHEHRFLTAALRWGSFGLALPLAACWDYSADPVGVGGTPPTSVGGSDAVGGGATAGGAGGSGGGDVGSGGRVDPPPPSCDNVSACGGDPVGTWFAQDTGSCILVSGVADVSALGIGCSEAPIEGTITVSGNWTLGADGTFGDNATTTAELTMELEEVCLDISGTVSQCDRIGLVMAGAAGLDSVVCTNSTITTGGCTCLGTVEQQGASAYPMGFNARTSGTYIAADNTITVTGTSARPGLANLAYSYCIDEGGFLHVTPTTPTIFGTVTGTVVFQRQ